MHEKISMNDVRQLSVAERILLVEDIPQAMAGPRVVSTS
jgi:hypothetical protein